MRSSFIPKSYPKITDISALEVYYFKVNTKRKSMFFLQEDRLSFVLTLKAKKKCLLYFFRKQTMTAEELKAYKVNYPRWLCYCHVPAFCDSLTHYDTTLIFGRTLLKSVFQTMRKQLMGKFRAEKDKMPAEKKTLVLTHFPRFLSLLEEEIYSNKSPIWDPDYR